MVQVNVGEAKAQLSRLLKLVEAGEEVVIARNGVPVARLVALTEEERTLQHENVMAHYRASVERNHKLYELLAD